RRAAGPTATTPGRLWVLAALVTTLTLAVAATAAATLVSTRDTARTVAERTSPAVVDAARAGALLADADLVAARSLLPPNSWGGPGDQYLKDIKTAIQALESAAENGTTGTAARAQLLAVTSLLVAYQDNVAQAYRYGATDTGATGTGAAGVPPAGPVADLELVYLIYAADLMREGTNILPTVAAFEAANSAALPDRGSWPWLPLGLHLGLALVLLGLLVVAQVYLRRRFRRRLSLGPLGAAVLLVLLAAGTTLLAARTSHDVDTTGRETTVTECLWQARATAVTLERERVVGEYAGAGQDTARPPADGAQRGGTGAQDGGTRADCPAPAAASAASVPELDRLLDDQAARLEDARAATVPAAGWFGVLAVGTVALLALTASGVSPRLVEYRK
ncbi:hypothetical protein I7412_14095, partial [Frankia sp. CN6]